MLYYFCRNRNTCFKNTFSLGVVYYCLRFYLQQASLVNSLGDMDSMSVINEIFDYHLRPSSHFWAVPEFYGLTLPTNPRQPHHPRYLADSLKPDAYRIEIDQFLQLVYLPKTHAILWNSHVYCNEMKFYP